MAEKTIENGAKELNVERELFRRERADVVRAQSKTQKIVARLLTNARKRGKIEFAFHGIWRSLVARLTGGQEVVSSNLAIPNRN